MSRNLFGVLDQPGYICRGAYQPHPIMTSSINHELMDSAPVSALAYPTDLNHLHLVTAVSVLDDMTKENRQMAEKFGEVRFARPPNSRTHPTLQRRLRTKQEFPHSSHGENPLCP